MLCTNCNAPVAPVVSVDLDGTLGDYHGHFKRFIEGYLGVSMRPEAYDYSEEFSEWLGVDKGIYREAKLAYRQGGLKRTMPIFPGATVLANRLKAVGVELWISTTRPHLRLDNIDPDTRHWLERHDIPYDGLIYGEDKYHQLITIVGKERIVAVVDDLPEQIRLARKEDLYAILKQNYHANVEWPAIQNLNYMERFLLERVRAWKEQNR